MLHLPTVNAHQPYGGNQSLISDSNDFWSKVRPVSFPLTPVQEIKEMIEKRFPMALQKDEKKPSYHLLVWALLYLLLPALKNNEEVDLGLLIRRFASMSGVELSPHVMKYRTGDELTLQRSDILSLKSRCVVCAHG